MTILDKVCQHAKAKPGAIALAHGARCLSYAELAGAAQSWAGALRAEGLQPGERIGVSLRESPEHVTALLAAAGAGLAILPLDWRAPAAERARLAEAFGVRAVLTEPGSAALPRCRCIPVDADWNSRSAAAVAHTSSAPDGQQPLLLNLSSGTSGQPKAAVVTHADFEARLARQSAIHGGLAEHRYLSVAPLCFSGGLMFCLYHLASGNPVRLYPPLFSGAELVDLITENEISYVFLVPTALRWLLRLDARRVPLLPELRVLLTSAAPITAEEKLAVRERICPNFFEYYATSAAGSITVLHPQDMDDHAASVGRPLGSLQLEIADADGRAVGAGTRGRVRCRGAGVSARLIGGDATSAASERFEDGWCYTGDLGWLSKEGFLYLAGRADEVIVRGGVNVQPEAIEQVLREHPAVADVVVVGRPSADLGQEAVALVQASSPVQVADLLAHCRGRLAGHMVPASIEFVDSFPRTPAGKIRRHELR